MGAREEADVPHAPDGVADGDGHVVRWRTARKALQDVPEHAYVYVYFHAYV